LSTDTGAQHDLLYYHGDIGTSKQTHLSSDRSNKKMLTTVFRRSKYRDVIMPLQCVVRLQVNLELGSVHSFKNDNGAIRPSLNVFTVRYAKIYRQ